MTVRLCLSYFGGLILCGVALAQDPTGPPNQATNPPGVNRVPDSNPSAYPYPGQDSADMGGVVSDKTFIKKAAEDNLTEVELAKLAQEKASSEAVKEFAKRMVDDQSRTQQQITATATKANVDVPSELPRSGKKAREKLSGLSGPEFDRAYAKQMYKDQKDTVDSFTLEARSGKVAEVKDFAAKTLPTLQEHRKMAEELQASLKR